jgi:hypothetical protein
MMEPVMSPFLRELVKELESLEGRKEMLVARQSDLRALVLLTTGFTAAKPLRLDLTGSALILRYEGVEIVLPPSVESGVRTLLTEWLMVRTGFCP